LKKESAMNQRIDPTVNAREIAQGMPGSPILAHSFRMLTAEPSTGVGILTLDGQIVYLNAQAARIFHGPEAKAEDYVGLWWRDHMPAGWVEERLKVFRTMLVHGKPVLMRTLWRDFQQFTWISHIEPESETLDSHTAEELSTGTDRHTVGAALRGPDHFLTITRRASGDDEAEHLVAQSEYELVESEVMRLKALAKLSPRELEVLALLGQGLSVKETAKVLFRSEKTVERHRDSIHQKLHASDRADLVKMALRAGLTVEDAERERV
jgi:DNA-binding CsgD family transcriptional regulator